MSYKFFLNEEETWEALEYAHSSNYNVHMFSDLAERVINAAMEEHEEI